MKLSTIAANRVAPFALCLALIAGACGSDPETTSVTAEDSSSTTTVTEDSASTTADSQDSPSTTTESVDGADDLTVRTEVITGAQWADNVTITVDGSTAAFSSDGLPSHEHLDQYLADGRDGKYIAGGVESYDASFEFPVVPTDAAAPVAAPNGAIGVAISGAVFFNPYEGDGSGTVANDDNSTIDGVPFIDACGGHPLPNAIQYHYHGIPFCITDAVDIPGEHSVLIGYMFDGYPIYGPQDVDGEEPTDLDECMGHSGPTPEFEDDTYHYHVSSTANYISECLIGEASFARGGAADKPESANR